MTAFHRARILAWLLASIGCQAAAPALAAPAAALDAGQEDSTLVEVRVDQLVLADSIAARPAPGGSLRLPLGELAAALGYAITVNAANGTAEGFVLREDRRFMLDTGKGLALLGGRPLPYDAERVERRADDIYVDLALLARWFPLELSYDPFALVVRVNPLEPLPAQQRLERERRAAQAGEGEADPRFPFVPTPYALFGDPAIDPQIGFSLAPDETGTLRPTVSFAALGDADLLGLNAAGFVVGTDRNPLTDWHVTVGRKDPSGALLGPLGARNALAGYVTDPGLPLLSTAWSGNGALLSSYPLSQPARFDRQSFRGPLPPGWDAQLFQNNYPIDYQPAGDTGEYRFDNVPLVVGPNEFRIVLNGPQGQRREEVRRVNIGATLTPPGERRYRVVPGVTLDGRARLTAIAEQGFTGHLSGAAGLARLPLPGGRVAQYGLVGSRGTLGELFWHVDGAAADDGGLATELGGQMAAGLAGLSVSQAFLKDFASEEYPASDDPVTARTVARLDARTPDAAWLPAVLALTGQVDHLRSDGWTLLVGNQLSARLGDVTATNVLSWDPGLQGAFSEGTFELGSRWRGLDLRGEVTYTPGQLTELAIVTSGQAFGDYRWTAATGYLPATGQPQLALQVNRIFDRLVAGFSVVATYPTGITAGLNLSAGLGWAGGGWLASGQSIATTGTATVHAFVDTNRNGRPDPGERSVPGLAVDIGGNTVVTDARGLATARGLAAYIPVDADFARVALEDPLLVPALKGVHFVPRPGRTTRIELPIVAVGEIYGTVRVREPAGPRELAGASLELVDAGGHVVASTIAGLDGYFALTEIPPGAYTLRVAPEQLAKLRLGPAASRAIAIPGEGAVLDGQDFELAPLPARKPGR